MPEANGVAAGESMTDSMIAIEIAGFGGPEFLKPAERPIPRPGKGELLIEVAAAGVNRPDVMQRQGGYKPPPGASDIPGLEVAGRVAALGEGVSNWRVGDPVTALVAGGGYAEFCAAPAPQCLPIPKGLDAIQAGALPETFFTVWTNVFDRGRLRAGRAFSSMAARAGSVRPQFSSLMPSAPGSSPRRAAPRNARPA